MSHTAALSYRHAELGKGSLQFLRVKPSRAALASPAAPPALPSHPVHPKKHGQAKFHILHVKRSR